MLWLVKKKEKKYVEFMYNPENEYNCDKCTIISKMQNMYKYTNYIFCTNRVLHVNHTLFYRKFKNIKRYTEHLLWEMIK